MPLTKDTYDRIISSRYQGHLITDLLTPAFLRPTTGYDTLIKLLSAAGVVYDAANNASTEQRINANRTANARPAQD